MADFNFDPPQIQLFGGQDTAWEPLGQESQLKPYQQPLGSDLYSKVFSPFNADRFKASLTSDPNRMKQAEQLFNQIDAMNFKPPQTGIAPYDFMQSEWSAGFGGINTAANNFSQLGMGAISMAPNNFPQLGAGTINPALSGNPSFLAQREAALQNAMNVPRFAAPSINISPADSAFAPPAGFAPPPISMGDMDLSFSQMSPAIQKQIFAQMGGGGSHNDSITDVTETLTRLAKVMKEDLTPAAKDYTEQVTRTVNAMTGGRGGAGGFGGGGFSGNDGGMSSDDFGWMHGSVRPEVMDRFGFGQDMPQFDDMSSSGFLSGWASNRLQPDKLSFNIWKATNAKRMMIDPMMELATDYQGQMASQDAIMLQSGMIGYDDLMSGQYGRITRRNVNAQERDFALGRQVDMAYGGFADMALSPNAMRGPLGAAAGIGLPSLGAGLGVAALLGTGAGLFAGGAMAVAGTIGYAGSAGQDIYEIGRWQEARANGERVGSDTFKGAIGQAASTAAIFMEPITGGGEQNRNIRANARDFYNNVNAFAAGEMSTSDLKAWANENNFNPSVAIGAGYDKFLETNANYGWSRDDQTSILALNLRYNPQSMPKANGIFGQQMALGGAQYTDWMDKNLSNIGSAMGVSGVDQAGMSGLLEMYTSNMYNVQQSGGNVGLYQESLQGQIAPIGRLNQARYRAGYGSVLGLDHYSALSDNPYIREDVQGMDLERFEFQGTDPGFAQNISDPLYNRASYYSRSGRPDVSGRMQGMIPQLKDLYYQGFAYGENPTQALRGYAQEAALSPENGAVIGLLGTGDRLALAQNAGMLGDIRYQTMDTKTGLPSMYAGMSRDWYSAMEQDQGGLFRLSYDQASVGTRGMEDRIRDMGRGLDQYQYNQQTASRNIDYQTLTGGARGINAQGFALGGDGLINLGSLFQSQGMAFNAGNGMGEWQLQDAGTVLSREQQQYRMNQSSVGLGLQGQNRDLSNRQWNESFAMNQQQFNMQTAYQAQNMDIGRGQQVTQEGWQSQDMAMSRNRMELSYGWQQEDYDRNIRFARGRQRVDLMRQQERSAISHSMDETQQGNEESRFKTETQWNKEEFDRKKEYFDTTKQLSQQEMELNKRHHDEKMALDNQSFALQQQEHEKEKQWMTQQWGLEDQRRLLDRQNQELQFKMSTDMAIAVKKVTDDTNLYKDALTAISREYNEINPQLDLAVKTTALWTAAMQAFNGQQPDSVFTPVAPSRPSSPAPLPKHIPGAGFKEGGYTGEGDPNQVAGVTHNREYVVPEGGALVVRGGGGGGNSDVLIPYLVQMIALLRNGIINATVYTNSNQINTGDLYRQSLARFK